MKNGTYNAWDVITTTDSKANLFGGWEEEGDSESGASSICIFFSKNISFHFKVLQNISQVYEFFWGKFCDKYIEDCKTSGETANLHPMLKKILILMHPFAPFITEEVNELIFDDGSLMD